MNNHNVPLNQVQCGTVCKPHTAINQKAGFFTQVSDFFKKLFDTSDWPPRWHCGTWSDFHGWLYIISDLCIWASYFLIPVLLIRMVTRRKDLPFPKIIWLFGAFIILCGLTHLLDAVIFWWPAYRLSALVRFFTAIVSMITVYALYKILPIVFSLRSVKELEHEINERRIVEEKLAASEFLLSEASRVSRVGGWEINLTTQTSVWSNTVYDIFELPYDFDINGLDITQFFAEPYKQQLMDGHENARQNGAKWDLELYFNTYLKNPMWVRSIGEPLFDENGKVIKLRGVFTDINQYKANEIALNQSLGLLAQQNQQLKSFTHILSHNIRNHASNISLLCNFMDSETLDQNNTDVFGKMQKVSTGLNNTLEDLSQALKIREGGVTSEVLQFKKVAQDVLNVLDADLKTNKAVVEIDFKIETVTFPGLYLESIIMNLVSNSLKYCKEDEHPHITLKTYFNNEKHKVFECSDNGIGIDLKLHGAKMFGLYKTFHKHKNAHGVGLFLVKNQIESQGGKVEVDSTPNIGTTFKIIFYEQN